MATRFSIRDRLTILDKYLIQQFTGPFFLAVGGFAIIGIVDILFYLVELAIISGVSFGIITRLLIYKLPGIMILFFPMAVLFSVMLLLVRMAKDNELTVLRTSGVTTIRIITPLFILTFLAGIISFVTNETIVPWANATSDRLIREQIRKSPPPIIVENVVFKDGKRHFYINELNNKKGEMAHILIIEQSSHFPRIISAKTGKWLEGTWKLFDGYIQEINENGTIEFLDKYKELTIYVDQDMRTYYKRQKTAKEMDSKELKRRIKSLSKGGISTRGLKVEYHMKASVPAACFIFGLMGIAFCLSFVRSGKDWWGVIWAILISVLMVGLYFFLLALCRALGKDGTLTPFLGAWLPNFFYGLIAISSISYQCKYK